MERLRFFRSPVVIALLVTVFLMGLALIQPVTQALAGNNGPRGDKVVICHIPPGNPSAAHTITVGAPAVQAHLAHGDKLGACDFGYGY